MISSRKAISLVLLLCLLQLTHCSSSSKITYTPSSAEFVVDTFKYFAGQQPFAIPQHLSCFTVGGGFLNQFKNDPFDVNYIFSEYFQKAQKIISIRSEIYAKDKNNEYTIKLPKIYSTVKLEYFDGKTSVKKTIQADSLFKEIPSSLPELNFPESNAMGFTLEDKFKMEDYPQEIKIIFTIKWKDGEKSFNYLLSKKQYQANKFNPKY